MKLQDGSPGSAQNSPRSSCATATAHPQQGWGSSLKTSTSNLGPSYHTPNITSHLKTNHDHSLTSSERLFGH